MTEWTTLNVDEWVSPEDLTWAREMTEDLDNGGYTEAMLKGLDDDPKHILMRGYYCGILAVIAGMKMEHMSTPGGDHADD